MRDEEAQASKRERSSNAESNTAYTSNQIINESVAVDPEVLELMQRIGSTKINRKFYLAGGTSLALQLGHRKSNDLDYFVDTQKALDRSLILQELEKVLKNSWSFEIVVSESGQLDLAVGKKRRKVSFIAYPFSSDCPRIRINDQLCASVIEIAAMKGYSLGRRTVARDYVDIAATLYLTNITLDEIINEAKKRFIYEEEPVFSERLFLQQLIYISDVQDADNLDIISITFNQATEILRNNVADYVRRSIK